ncbi:MAG: type II toxin-antitoxin system VapC family toxin [Gemmatimonadota bacterium]
MLDEPGRFSTEALGVIESEVDDLLLSAASAWEIAIKYAIGKLKLPERPEAYIPGRMQQTNVFPLRISHDHAARAGGLPPYHRDPFDRLLIAQAQLENLPIITADPRFEAYGIQVIPAA